MPEPELKKYDDDLQTVNLPGVEVFSVGKWNGDEYSSTDLDEMISAFNDLKSFWEPVAKAGHEDGQQKPGVTKRLFGVPALGYVQNLYRKGEKLIADFKDVPKKFAQLIGKGTYKRVSSEVYWNYTNPASGKKYPRVLRAVAFLGAEIPAVTNLKEIEALFSANEDGALVAYDENKNEYRAYEHDYCGMDSMVSGYSARKLDKATVNYSEDGGSENEDCGSCRYMQGNQCSIVEGTVDYNGYCDLQKPRPGMKAKMSDDDQDITSYEQDGKIVEAKNYFVRKKGSKWCVVSHEGKELGCHPTRAEAVNQLRAVEANKHATDDDPKKHSQKPAGGTDMTQEELEALLKERDAKMYKEFEDRIHKAREEGKEEALKENEVLREDIRKLQLEKRSERIEHWIKGMKEKGQILPSEESRVRALRQWLPDEGEGLKYFAVKDGQTKEFSAGPAELFESLFKDRKSVYTNYSRADDEPEDTGSELQDPSAEVDRRAKLHQEKMAKDGKQCSYREALTYVLKNSPGLALRYQDASRRTLPN